MGGALVVRHRHGTWRIHTSERCSVPWRDDGHAAYESDLDRHTRAFISESSGMV